MRIKIFALAALLCCGWLAGCRSSSNSGRSGQGDDKSPIIAEINGSAEHLLAFERFVKARLSDFEQQNSSDQIANDKRRSQLLEAFIQRQLIVQAAAEKNIEPTDDEIRNALESQHKQTNTNSNNGEAKPNSEGEVSNQVTLQGAERRLEIYNDLLTLKFYKTEVLKDVQVSPQEIEKYYNENSAVYQGKNGFYVREIRVGSDAEAQKVYRQALAKPDDFAVLAKEHSEAPTASGGGLIYYEAQMLPPVLEQAITPLKVGSISRVVRSNYGFHIFKLEQRGESQPLDKVRKEIEDKLLSLKNQALIEEFNKRALAGAKIKIFRDRLGFNYSGGLGS